MLASRRVHRVMTGRLSARSIDPAGTARQPARMIRVVSTFACVCALVLAMPRTSFAEEPAPPPPASEPPAAEPVESRPEVLPAPSPVPPRRQRSREITVEIPGERSRNNKIMCASITAAGAIASAFAVYWHLDSRDASNELSADAFTGEAWTPEKVALVERADRSKTRATVAYSIGGALLIGAIATWILTEPESETAIIRTGGVTVTPTFDGGGMVTKLWSF